MATDSFSGRALGMIGGVSASLLMTGNVALATDATATEPVATSTPSTIDEIVVTAQRREERIDKVPQAVQAITGTELTRAGVDNISESIALIPSATTESTIGPGATAYQIRGVASGETDGDATVGYYLDNFAFSMPGRPMHRWRTSTT
jgi:iron complex outermembrane receptor protein